jgi:pimeloyl-ACP methyl ester carboxylesterase
MNEARYLEVEQRLWISLGLEPVERHLRLPHLDTLVRLQEIGDGPLVVFVHGASASGANWAPLLPYVHGFRCVLVDRPGCGTSPAYHSDIHTVDRFLEYADTLIVDLLDALEAPTAHIVSTSLGGCFTLRGAAAHSDRLDRIVEFGFVVGAPISRVPISMRLATMPGVRRLMTSIPPTRGAVRALLRGLGLGPALADGRITDESFEWFVSLLRDTPTLRNESELPRALLEAAETSVLLPANVLARVQSPVKFIWGGCDPFGGADVAELLVQQLSDAELEIWPASGHAPWIDDPKGAGARVVDFLGD